MQSALIMFDGPDGVGKTTQIHLAAEALRSEGRTVSVFRINGGSEFGEQLRNVVLGPTPRQPMSEHYVFMAMHTELRHVMRPHLAAGEIILMDRSPLSDWAYQKFGGGLESAQFDQDVDASMKQFAPSLIICYTADLPTLRKRMTADAAKADYFESKPDAFFRKVIEGYSFAAKRYNAERISADQPIEAVHEATMRTIHSVLNETK